MTVWIDIEEKAPEDTQRTWAYFQYTGATDMVYHALEGTVKQGLGKHLFVGEHGFLIDDITHWMPYSDEKPKPPK